MSVWTEVRRQARVWHTELTAGSGILVPADRILAAVEAQTGITSEPRPPGDALLENAEAIYDPERKRVYYSSATDPALARFHVAHEYAHHRIDAALARCGGADFDPTTPAQPETSLLGEADAYSPKERSEALANLFARELLLPRDKLRALSGASVFDAERIAHDLGVPTDLVMQQLADALLLPVERDQTEQAAPERPPDQFQREAISASDRPLRVRAGPGTGKTRTLIGRVEHLVKRGENPRGVVVLTFSNLSAQDLALRIRAAVGEAATGIWSGTFHAFGLELLRKYGGAIGLPIDLRLLDRSGSLQVLEDLLGKLHLKHYLDLSEPLRKLRFVLALISRAKDELATPADYEAHAQRMKSEARDEEAREEADRALEVARAYAAYEQRLREKGLVDFGDLIVRSIELLRNHPDIRETVRKERPHVLVDEYQDMNRTSGLLLQQLVTANRGPWVVGDVRQAIYRFRGASPINMERFGQDFPGAVTSDLGVNYRSGGRIIRTFETFGRQMTGVAADMKQLHADRGEELGSISLDVASTLRAEYEGIARRIHSSVAQGAQYGDHAILARSHTVLARLSRHLERSGVPCLYFGDFFERGEIRDLLALISVAAENGGIGLLRVCQFPQYATPARDVRRVIAWRQEHEIRMLDAIRRLDEIADLSDAGRASLARLREDLSRVDFPMSAHRFLFDFLFRRGTHLQPLLADTSVPGQQRRLAIYQLLQFAGSFRASAGVEPKRAFLAHVRRLEMLDEEKQLRQLPAAASDINAVRMMTIHASKGLQFPIVHLPAMTNRHFPFNRRESHQLPPGLIDSSALMTPKAEEEALFFVALSRTRDAVYLSRAIDCGGGSYKNLGPSEFLERIGKHLNRPPGSSPNWTEGGPVEPEMPRLEPPPPRESWPAQAIETYLKCPRRFYYSEVLQLGGSDARPPFLSLRSALRSSVDWWRSAPTGETSRARAREQLAAAWKERVPRNEALAPLYLAAAEQMLEVALNILEGGNLPNELSLTLTGDLVLTCSADHVKEDASGVVVQRWKMGRLSKREEPKVRYTVAQAALARQHGPKSVRFEHVSLQDAEVRAATIVPNRLPGELAKLEVAFRDIAAGRFEPRPNEHDCPSCPYFFVCPSHLPRAGT